MEANNSMYVGMMSDSLKRKREVLEALYELTEQQSRLLSSEEFDVDAFEELLDQKGNRIDDLNRLDDGFGMMYQRVEEELLRNQQQYQQKIKQMKGELEKIADLMVKIQVLEKRNTDSFRNYMTKQKTVVRNANQNHRTISAYSQSMAGADSGNSFFFNEKK